MVRIRDVLHGYLGRDGARAFIDAAERDVRVCVNDAGHHIFAGSIYNIHTARSTDVFANLADNSVLNEYITIFDGSIRYGKHGTVFYQNRPFGLRKSSQ